jgi:hypothetical protein
MLEIKTCPAVRGGLGRPFFMGMELRERGARGREGEEIVWRCKYAKAYKSQ